MCIEDAEKNIALFHIQSEYFRVVSAVKQITVINPNDFQRQDLC